MSSLRFLRPFYCNTCGGSIRSHIIQTRLSSSSNSSSGNGDGKSDDGTGGRSANFKFLDDDGIPEGKKTAKPADYIPITAHETEADFDPIKRAVRILKWDWGRTWQNLKTGNTDMRGWEAQIFPQFCDFLIIGGGIMGSAVAYYLKKLVPSGPNVVIIEKDPSYAKSASVNSMGLLRTQFSQELNVKAAMFGMRFLRRINEELNLQDYEPKDLLYNPQGFLFLGTQADVALMETSHRTQLANGAKVALVTPDELQRRYPWMNFEDVALGSYGLENEGWFDPWRLLYALKEKNMSMGVHYVDGELTGFKYNKGWEYTAEGKSYDLIHGQEFEQINYANVDTFSHGKQMIKFSVCVNAAGIDAAHVCHLADIGVKKGVRCIPLPVEKRKRFIYSFHCPDFTKLSFPILVDPNGICVRRDGLNGMYMCSYSPKTNDEEPDPRYRKPDEKFFEEVVWPKLAYRVPAFQNLQLRGSWTNFYDYNYFDQSPIIGPHPYMWNMYLACGLSGYPLQHAPAVAKAIADILFDSTWETEPFGDTRAMNFERLIHFEPVQERIVV